MSNGRFVWYDLMTNDVEGAKKFYTHVVGYEITPWDQGDKPYAMWTAGGKTIGGVMTHGEDNRDAPPQWLGYIDCDDVDATAKKVEALGGRILRGGTDIPTVGRFAVLADPCGAPFALFKSLKPTPPSDAPPGQGEVGWHELNTTDYNRSWEFYRALFGWKEADSMDMGPELGTYFMFKYADAAMGMGGMSNVAKVHELPPHWLFYITVHDLDGALQRAQQREGKLLNGPMEVPGGSRIAQLVDAQGASFALHEPKRD